MQVSAADRAATGHGHGHSVLLRPAAEGSRRGHQVQLAARGEEVKESSTR